MHFIIRNYLFVNLPIGLCLAFKIYFGIRWFKKGMTYPALSTFYLMSWTFYTSYVLAESLIIFVGFDSFTNLYITWTVSTMVVCLLAWIMLYFHVRQSEVNNRKMNEYRR